MEPPKLASTRPFVQVSRVKLRRRLRNTAMKVEVSDPLFVYTLLYSLKSADYEAELDGDTTVEVQLPAAASPEEAQFDLGLYLAKWRGRHPGIVAELVETR
jgi:hypothetical protein